MDITDLNIGVIYTNTMQTIIDIINDIVMFFDNPSNKFSSYQKRKKSLGDHQKYRGRDLVRHCTNT